jgi:hypothetical protein
MDFGESISFAIGVSVATERLLETVSMSGTTFGNWMINTDMAPVDEEKDVNNWKGVRRIKTFLAVVFGPLKGWGEKPVIMISSFSFLHS